MYPQHHQGFRWLDRFRVLPVLLATAMALQACGGGGGGRSSTPVTPSPTPANKPPVVASGIPARSATQDASFGYTVPGGTFTDPDGDALTLSARRTDGSALPAWLTFNGSAFTGIPDFGDIGTLNVRVTASDGKGGNATTDFVLTVAPAPAIPLSLYSYDNFKLVGLQPTALPAGVAATENAHAWADFAGHHRLDLFVASTATTYADRKPAIYAFYERKKDGTLAPSNIPITGAALGCVVPRKALVADLNGDAKPDVFLACHGVDEPPFPGEPNTVVLSRGDGSYEIKRASADLGFFHAGATLDANGDSKPDVIVAGLYGTNGAGARTARVALFINNGDGSFALQPGWTLNKTPFTIEIVDVDGDGKRDMVTGGHEWIEPASVYLGDGSANFAPSPVVTLPTSPGFEVSLDFLVTGSGASRALWVFRVGGTGPDGGPDFYRKRAIQRIAWPTLTHALAYQDNSTAGLPWLIATSGTSPLVSSDWAGNMSTPLY